MRSADRRLAALVWFLLLSLCGAASRCCLAQTPPETFYTAPFDRPPQEVEGLPPVHADQESALWPDRLHGTANNPRDREISHKCEQRPPTEGGHQPKAGRGADYTCSSGSSHWLAALPPCKWRLAKEHVCRDYRTYYSWPTARDLFLGVGAAAVFANTSWDQDLRDWYQHDVRSPGTDNFSSFWKPLGEGEIFIGVFAGLAVAGTVCDDRPLGNLAGQFGGRVTRGYLVGAPPMLFMQAMLGGSRPNEDPRCHSSWKPFDDNNAVSGHAFIGSVPFITAAQMSERPLVKGGFYFLSTLPAWSRVNDDAHYFSQACLGWWMGYLACRVVNQTNCEDQAFSITPVATPAMTGLQVTYRR